MKLIKQFLFTFIAFMPLFAFSQDSTKVKTDTAGPLIKETVFVGINSAFSDRSILSLALIPTVGIAISDRGIIHASLKYVDSEIYRIHTSFGYDHFLTNHVFVGALAYCNKYDDTKAMWGASAKLGYYKEIVNKVFVSPQAVINKGFDKAEPWAVSLDLTFGLRL